MLAARCAAVVLTAVLGIAPALPCAPAPPRGVRVSIVDETALIVWDEATRTEHFIRGATFSTEAVDFGFLVPTPTEPELAEVSESLFDNLESTIQPAVVRESRLAGITPAPIVCWPVLLMKAGSEGAPMGAPVRVLKEQRVAGYDAAVLQADDAGALATWLAEHGYDDRPTLRAWLEPYVAARATVTAFKVAKPGDGGRVATSAVRMTFRTEQPVFPYREPAEQRQDRTPRKLFVFVLATARVEGSIGASPWPAKLLWSDRVPDASHGWLADALPGGSKLPAPTWLTAFEDSSAPRGGDDDLLFAPSASATAYRPPPIVAYDRWYLPLPVDVIAGISGFVFWRRRRRRRAR